MKKVVLQMVKTERGGSFKPRQLQQRPRPTKLFTITELYDAMIEVSGLHRLRWWRLVHGTFIIQNEGIISELVLSIEPDQTLNNLGATKGV